ncbi:MAG: Ig-like domain-containing protein [Wenzhouxiangella sp.]
MQIFRSLSALALLAAGSFAVSDEQLDQDFQPSDFTVAINGADLGLFPALAVDNGERVLRYDTQSGRISLAVGQSHPARFLNPLTCFQFGPPAAASLDLTDINGIAVSQALGFSPRIRYEPDTHNPLITIEPGVGSRCFYRGDASAEFGLFGQPADTDSDIEGQIFADRFEADERLQVRFQNLPAFVNPGDTLNYQVVISNIGSVALSGFSLQELVPLNDEQFDASVTGAIVSCNGPSTLCPPTSGVSNIRFDNLMLGIGQSLTFNIIRLVDGDSVSGSLIDVYAAAATADSWDVAEEQIIVIGAGDSLAAVSDGGTAGIDFEIEVTALDINNNPVPFIEITVDDTDGLSFVSLSETTSLATGSATFLASSETAGSYQPVFSASGLGSVDLIVEVSPAAPALVTASAPVPQGTADGSTPAVVALTVRDSFLNPVPAVAVTVVDSGGLDEVSSADPFTDSNGVASFQAFSSATGTFTVELGVADVGSDSVQVSFVPGAAFAMGFLDQPGDVGSGEAFSIALEILDSAGNRVTDDSQTEVQLLLRQAGSTVGSLGFETANQGLVTFSNLTVNTVGSNYVLRAVDTDSNLNPVDSDPFAVTGGNGP